MNEVYIVLAMWILFYAGGIVWVYFYGFQKGREYEAQKNAPDPFKEEESLLENFPKGQDQE